MLFNYNNKRFQSQRNTANGEVSAATIFHYWQEKEVVWATYQGGNVKFGTLIGQVDRHGVIDMRYQHLNTKGEFKTGQCHSTPEKLEDGRIRLHESWQWTNGDLSTGKSIIQEV